MMASRTEQIAKGNSLSNCANSVSWRLKLCRLLTVAQKRLDHFSKVTGRLTSLLTESTMVGLLKHENVEQLVSETYESKPQFYDPRTYQLPHEKRILPLIRLSAKGTRLLDAFCGQGREAELFARAGYRVTGVDRLSWMIQAARKYASEAGFEAQFAVQDFHRLNSQTQFDVVYTSCWMYSTVQSRSNRLRFLNQCSQLAKNDGLIVISIVDASNSSSFGLTTRFLISKFVGWLSGGNRNVEYGERIYSGLFWHHLSYATVLSEAAEVGLKIDNASRGNGIEPTFFLLRKMAEANGISGGERD